MTSQGHGHARFKRALATGNPTIALSAAADLPTVGLADALELTVLLRSDERRYARAAARWAARYALEQPGVEAAELLVVVGSLLELARSENVGTATLRAIFAERGRGDLARALAQTLSGAA